ATVVSRDGGKSWNRWTHEENHDDVNLEGGVVQCADGTILALDSYVMPGEKKDHGIGELWKSHDDFRTLEGPTWVDFFLPTIQFTSSTDDGGRPHGAARLHRSIIELPNGDLLTTMYAQFAGDTASAGYIASMKKSRTVVIRSGDHGGSWAYLATVAVDGGVGTEGFSEPVLARITQGNHAGRLVCIMRTGRELYQSDSDDDGKSWTRPKPSVFPGIDIYRTQLWESLFVDPKARDYVPNPDMLGSIVDPDLIEMQNGTLVCSFGVRTPEKKYKQNWRSPMNGNYLAFSRDGGETWGSVVQYLSGMPTTQYTGVREIAPDVLYVVYDNSIFRMPGETMGFRLEVHAAGVAVGQVGASAPARASEILRGQLAGPISWEQMHAAEALISCNEKELVRTRFEQDQLEPESLPLRISRWRMLAASSASELERQQWMSKIEHQLLDPSGAGRTQSLEVLGKLGHRLSGPSLAVAELAAAEPLGPDSFYALLALALAGESNAETRIAAYLTSPDAAVRGRAASALRWLRPQNAGILGALALAAEREPSNSPAYASVLSAALSVNALPSKAASWQKKLEHVLATGSPRARLDACQGLQGRSAGVSLNALAPALDDPHPDTRIAAAWFILRASRSVVNSPAPAHS
ncbi:MAG: hypothetical protein ABI222_16965, partial [Opitutaceae bacterium]